MVALTNRNDCVSRTCRSCSESISLMVNGQDVVDWKGGKYIQDAMPYLSAAERELLISGTCGTCFDKMFGGSE